MPTYNRRHRLGPVLAALEQQSCGVDAFDVVVVSDGSTDQTDEFLANLETTLTITTEQQENAGPAAARNRGVALATAPIVLFLDDDVIAEPDLVAEHLARHELSSDLVVIGPTINPPGNRMEPWDAWEQAMLHKQYDALAAGEYDASHRQFYTANASLPRARFLETGGFDTRLRRAEDVEFAFRLDQLGMRFEFNPRAVGQHLAERPFASWLRTAREYGKAEVVFGRDNGQDPSLVRVRGEFRRRHPFIKVTSRMYVAAPFLTRAVEPLLRRVAGLAYRAHLPSVSRQAYSVIYNGTYYRAMAEQLGGRAAFRRAILRRNPEPS